MQLWLALGFLILSSERCCRDSGVKGCSFCWCPLHFLCVLSCCTLPTVVLIQTLPKHLIKNCILSSLSPSPSVMFFSGSCITPLYYHSNLPLSLWAPEGWIGGVSEQIGSSPVSWRWSFCPDHCWSLGAERSLAPVEMPSCLLSDVGTIPLSTVHQGYASTFETPRKLGLQSVSLLGLEVSYETVAESLLLIFVLPCPIWF